MLKWLRRILTVIAIALWFVRQAILALRSVFRDADERQPFFTSEEEHAARMMCVVAMGRDASDVALTTSFGTANLKGFSVITDEVPQQGTARAST